MRVAAGPLSTALTGIVLKISARGSIFDPRNESTLFLGSKNGDFGGFLDITRLVGLVIASNLVQTASNTCSELCTVLSAAMTHDITHKMRKSNGK